jgi:hypothetical protein
MRYPWPVLHYLGRRRVGTYLNLAAYEVLTGITAKQAPIRYL